MSWKIRGKLEGLAAATRKLDGLKKAVKNKILRRAITAAARLTLKSVKAAQRRKRTAQLKKSLGMAVRTYPRAVVGVVGPRKGFGIVRGKQRIDPIYYAHLVDAGVKAHRLGKGSSLRKKTQAGGMHPGIPGEQFMERGWAAAQGPATAKAVALIAEGIAQEAAKAA